MSKINIIFLGGCHVAGWPIGEEFSFPNILKRKIENNTDFSINIQQKNNVNLKNVLKKIQEVKKISNSRNIICLQMGNYETSSSLFSKFKNSKLKKNIAATNENENSNIKNYFVIEFFHFFIDKILRVFGQNSFDQKMFYEQCRDLHFYLQTSGYNDIIIISPFPCLHLSVNSRRRIANKVFSSLFKDKKYKYINTIALFGNKRNIFNFKPNKDYFEDSFHLNAAGHCLLADEIDNLIIR